MTTELENSTTVYTPQVEYEDYFGFGSTLRWHFPDGKQWIEYQVMNEGQKQKFQKQTSRDINVDRASGSARFRADIAADREALILNSVVAWNLMRKGTSGNWEVVPFSGGSPGSTLAQWMKGANPRLIEDLEREIRDANPWLNAEMEITQVDEEITRLQELREKLVKDEERKSTSSNR